MDDDVTQPVPADPAPAPRPDLRLAGGGGSDGWPVEPATHTYEEVTDPPPPPVWFDAPDTDG